MTNTVFAPDCVPQTAAADLLIPCGLYKIGLLTFDKGGVLYHDDASKNVGKFGIKGFLLPNLKNTCHIFP